MAVLGVNVDHVATLRQARYREQVAGLTPEPSVLDAALVAEKVGAKGITVHLREDRRHIQEHDVADLRRAIKTRLNLEMAVTNEMVRYALLHRPEEVCLVPENRKEITTEGGLNITRKLKKTEQAIRQLKKSDIVVSCFIDPDPDQIKASADCGATFIELHTGTFANATTKRELSSELRRQVRAFKLAKKLGLRVNAGHGLNYENTSVYLAALPEVEVLNIGHAIVSASVMVGFRKAVRNMVKLIDEASASVA